MLFSTVAFGQVQITRQVIGSTGGAAAGTNIAISYTVGETVIQTISNSMILTQGFQQPDGFVELGDSLIIYSGITPNEDGVNDTWIIDNIQKFPENTVQIFNRWGNEVWSGDNYDNTTVIWEGNNHGGEELANSTYFYMIVVEGATYRGWVELTR